MPIGILIIMKRSRTLFSSARDLADKIDNYFNYIEGEYHIDKAGASKQAEQKIWDREPEPATIAGLALFLGFNSIQAFNEYEQQGRFASSLKKGSLRVESVYERKLHLSSSAGAIFALKMRGWDSKKEELLDHNIVADFKMKMVKSGPELAASERDVTL